jgi:hypothetical protein
MTVDLTRFPYNAVSNVSARTLTEAIAAEPVDDGFVVVTLKATDPSSLAAATRNFAQQLRLSADTTGFQDITACRQLRRDEMGGAVPFDQAFCESVLDDIAARRSTQSSRFPGLAGTEDFVLSNVMADWVLLITFGTTAEALTAAQAWRQPDSAFAASFSESVEFTINAFENMMRYAHVSLDPDVIQFFNLFPGPGDPDGLWPAWEEVLPRYFDAAEIRSSFPLKALDPEQPLILVNYAHADSVKHFLLSMIFDPNFLEDIARCYQGRGFAFPHPFFCKVVPV